MLLVPGFPPKTALASFVFAFAVSLSLAQELPKVPQAGIFTLTPTVGPFTEPAVAVNPANPEQVVAVFQDNAHAAYSQDGGRTWQLSEEVAPKNYFGTHLHQLCVDRRTVRCWRSILWRLQWSSGVRWTRIWHLDREAPDATCSGGEAESGP